MCICLTLMFIVIYTVCTLGKIIAKEESSVGSVSWKVYCAFMKAGGGMLIVYTVNLALFGSHGTG